MSQEVVRYTTREIIRTNTVRYTLRQGGGIGGGIPVNALVDRNGNPILDRDGNYILVGHG